MHDGFGAGSCWINAGLQALFGVRSFRVLFADMWQELPLVDRRALYTKASRPRQRHGPVRERIPASEYERRLAVTFQTASEAPHTDPVRPYLLTDAFYNGRQDDASEFLARVLHCDTSRQLGALLGGRMEQYLECTSPACGATRESEAEAFGALLLPLQAADGGLLTTVQAALDAYMPREVVELPAYPCSRCSCAGFSKFHCVTAHPRVLQLCLNRWVVQSDGIRALLHAVSVDERVVFHGRSYSLSAVVVHLGSSPQSGHYICIARHETASGRWWVYDDDRRLEARPEEIATDTRYRGREQMKSYVMFYELMEATPALESACASAAPGIPSAA